MKFNEIIDGVKDSINDTKLKVVKAVDDAELDKRAKEFGNVAGDKLKSIDIQKMGTELFDTVSKGAKDGASFVSQGLKDGGDMINKGAESFKKSVADFKEQKEVSLDDQLHDAVNKYNAEYAEFEGYGSAILIQRERSVDVLNNVEILINSIANHPKSFDVDLQDIQLDKKKFKDVCDYAVDELTAAKKSALSTGAGLSCGVAVASLAPSPNVGCYDIWYSIYRNSHICIIRCCSNKRTISLAWRRCSSSWWWRHGCRKCNLSSCRTCWMVY